MRKVSELKASLTDMLIEVDNSIGMGTHNDYGELNLSPMLSSTSDVCKMRDEILHWMVQNGLIEDDGE